MKIDKVTITGADNKVHYNDLLNLQEDYPFVEWGVLFSECKEGQQRYPSTDHRKKQFIGDLNLSAHLCGWWAYQVLEEMNYKLILDLPPQYKRVQLNYNFFTSRRGFYLDGLNDIVLDREDMRIILQYNNSNQNILEQWMRRSNLSSRIHFLYDSSGGNGIGIKSICNPIGGHYTGYAGGINLQNLDAICCDIRRHANQSSVWVDLESGARTNNDFDLKLVRKLLDKFQFHVQKS